MQAKGDPKDHYDIIIFAGIALAVVAAALSHLVLKAAALQEQSDLTIWARRSPKWKTRSFSISTSCSPSAK